MKEQFRDKLPSGIIKTKYWIDKKKGKFSHFLTDATTLMDQIISIVEYYESIEINLTNRQLYYQLVGKDFIPNAMEIYKRICTLLTDMRYAGLIDWNTIEDKSRVPVRKAQWVSVQSLIDSATSQYRLPRWQDQDYHVEMYCEKEAGVNVLNTICEKYHIYFGFNKGYSSASAMYDLAKRVGERINTGKQVIILYFGDHDPSGLDMIRDINDRITEFLTDGEDFIEPLFKVVNVALTMEQIKEFSPPPNPAKITDPRAKEYIRKFGNVSWELDAIDALELRSIAEEAVLRFVDMEKYNAWIEIEKDESQVLIDFGKSLED